jgi:hypothetical protein
MINDINEGCISRLMNSEDINKQLTEIKDNLNNR